MKTTKTGIQKRQDQQTKLYRSIVKTIGIDKAVKTFGERDVKWAINRYLVSVRDRARLLKQKAEAEQKIKEIEQKL